MHKIIKSPLFIRPTKLDLGAQKDVVIAQKAPQQLPQRHDFGGVSVRNVNWEDHSYNRFHSHESWGQGLMPLHHLQTVAGGQWEVKKGFWFENGNWQASFVSK